MILKNTVNLKVRLPKSTVNLKVRLPKSIVNLKVRLPKNTVNLKARLQKKYTAIFLVLCIVICTALCACGKNSEPETETTTKLAGPDRPAIVSEVSIASTGDILMHSPIISACYDYETGGYDFSGIFSQAAGYYSEPDIMVANLEVTLGGEESGEYSGYPTFNCPDSIITALKNAGVDMLLTANNHAYDTGHYGFMRTQQILDQNGLAHIGTRQSEAESSIYVADVNDIKIGMACYTYDTRETPDEQKSLNGIPLEDEDAALVNSFTYSDLETFYASVENDLASMAAQGAQANIFYIHWGNEYEDEPCELQTEIAQRLCDMGVDVIVGGHPHVEQKFEVLTNALGHETICLYSMGNEISNQRAEYMDEDGNRGYTEDGVIFTVTFEKFNNGKVKLKCAEVLPTWVDAYTDENGQVIYKIIALDTENTDSWQASSEGAAWASYERTRTRVGLEGNIWGKK